MDCSDGEKSNLEVENLQLIDILSEDDFLVASLSGDPYEELRLSALESGNKRDGFDLFNTWNHPELENAVGIFGQREQETFSSEPVEPEKESTTGMFNLRESLAWDSAFFTSAGVLDPEELSIVNKGFKKDETHQLPGILEDLQRSTESNSTLDSDDFSLGNLEVDLFEDVRVSIQKSSKAFNVASSSCTLGQGDMQNIPSSKKLDIASQNGIKLTPTPGRQSVNVQGSGRTKKELSVHPRAAQNNARSRCLSSFNSPKILGQTKPMLEAPTKWASLGANRVKMENKAAGAASGKGMALSKKPGFGDSCSVFPGCTSSPKSSSSIASPASNDSTVSCSSHNKSGSASSIKSSSSSLRKKIDSRNAKLAASGSNLKFPMRHSTANKTELGNSNLSTHLLSVSSLSSCTSPASSIDGCSSESSSTSAVNQAYTNSKASLDTTAFGGISSDSDTNDAIDLQSRPPYQSYVGNESQQTAFPNQCVKKGTTVTGPIDRDVARRSKPSGLRMPSPKIGFFDEKSMASTLNGGLKFHSGGQSALPKIRTGIGNLNGIVKTRRPAKPQPYRTSPEMENVMLGSAKTGVTRPAAPEVYGTFGFKRHCLGTGPIVQTKSFSMGRENCLDARKVGSGGHDEVEPGLEPSMQLEEKGTQGVLKNKLGMEGKRQVHLKANKISPKADEAGLLENDINPFETGHVEAGQPFWNDKHLLKRDEKENIHNFEDEVDGLSRQIGAINFCREIMIELKEKKGYSHSQCGNMSTVNYGAPLCLSFSGKQLLHDQPDDSLNILSKFSPHSLPSTHEHVSSRTPLAVKDNLCNISEEQAVEKA